MRREFATNIGVEASPLAVWNVLTDFGEYPEWNSFLLKVRGTPRVGAWVRFKFDLPRGFRAWACARVLKAETGRELRWVGGVPGLFRAEHYFILDASGGSELTFLHGEIFTGALLALVWPVLSRGGKEVYEAMNIALKKRAERTAG